MEITKIIIKYFNGEKDIFTRDEVDNFYELLGWARDFINEDRTVDTLYVRSDENYKVNIVRTTEIREIELVRKQEMPEFI